MTASRLNAGLAGVPLGREGGLRLLLPWLFAIVVYVAGASGVGLLVTADSLYAWRQALAAGMTVTVPADTSAARLETVLALLRQAHGVQSVSVADTAETARLLQPWLGPSAHLDELPVPKLIDVHTDPGQAIDLAILHKQLISAAPDAQLDSHVEWLERLRKAALRIQIVCAGAVATAAVLAAAIGVLTTRAALDLDRELVELTHLLGAADADIARPFALRALIFAMLGGAIGAAGVIATVAVLGAARDLLQLPAAVGGAGAADWRVWAIALGAAIAGGLIAAAGAQLTMRRRLAAMP